MSENKNEINLWVFTKTLSLKFSFQRKFRQQDAMETPRKRFDFFKKNRQNDVLNGKSDKIWGLSDQI